MQHFKFVNWGIGEFMISFFDVKKKLYVTTYVFPMNYAL